MEIFNILELNALLSGGDMCSLSYPTKNPSANRRIFVLKQVILTY